MTAALWNTKGDNDRVWTREVFVPLAATTPVMSDGALKHLAFELALGARFAFAHHATSVISDTSIKTSTGVTSRNLRPQRADDRTCSARRRL